ncbi:MAG: 2OG-Fe(II) oxygenase [Pseudomonadota bacterium]
MKDIRWLAKDIGIIENFLTETECEDYIAFAETTGFEEATVSTEIGMVMMKDIRNNDRVMVDDFDRADDLYIRISEFLPQRFKKKWQPAGLNERLRFYRYDSGQQFDWHGDGYFERTNGERSFFTFMVYLNEGFDGGGTSFQRNLFGNPIGTDITIVPQTGLALIFHHPLMHRGDPVIEGRKYVLRSDVMFSRIGAVEESTIAE